MLSTCAGHVAAVDKLANTPDIGCVAYNLGTGTGTTVLEMVHVSCPFRTSCIVKRDMYICPGCMSLAGTLKSLLAMHYIGV